MPFARFYLGVHSLDQILYGTSLGIWGGIVCHFLLRDGVINIFRRIKKSQLQDASERKKKNAATYVEKLE